MLGPALLPGRGTSGGSDCSSLTAPPAAAPPARWLWSYYDGTESTPFCKRITKEMRLERAEKEPAE